MPRTSNNIFAALTIAAVAMKDVQEITPLHDEARYHAIVNDADEFVQLLVANFIPNDQTAIYVSKLISAALDEARKTPWVDVAKAMHSHANATPSTITK